MLRRTLSASLAALGILLAAQVHAGISLSSTRIIFNSADKEAGVTVRNTGEKVLIQSWLDSGDAADDNPPFAVTPPLARIPANEQQLLRILYEGRGLPDDRESVVWLNVQEIPQAIEGENILQLAVRQRIKVFFRPSALAAEAQRAPEKLRWTLEPRNGNALLRVKNPSPYYVSMADVRLNGGGKKIVASDSTMVGPGEEKEFPIAQALPSGGLVLSFSSINDYGAQVPFTANLTAGNAAAAMAKRAAHDG
ncbi:fimbrial biogenesis chaperone [Pseudomonas sp. OTU5201]|uniref:fimbrial biogenesis chaperone n=1 Tax=Pseudomonas sp. OTU5201 TaxID=3043850 RepID=UPI00313C57D2